MENATLLAFTDMQIKRFKANQLIMQLIVAFNWNAYKNSYAHTHTFAVIHEYKCMEASDEMQI